MSHSSRLFVSLPRPVAELVDHTFLEDSTGGDGQNSFLFGSATANEETVCLQDLLNSPEFIEEQKVILLEFEAARLRITEDERSIPPPPPQIQMDRRSRRSSIGIKLNCPICLESLGSARSSYVKMVTQCGHVFCQGCIENVCEVTKKLCNEKKGDFNAKTLCPICREEIGELRKIYF